MTGGEVIRATRRANPMTANHRRSGCEEVASVEEALQLLALPADGRIVDLDLAEMAVFRRLIRRQQLVGFAHDIGHLGGRKGLSQLKKPEGFEVVDLLRAQH